MLNILKPMQTDLYDGDMDAVEAATRKAINEGVSPKEILDDGLIMGMDTVGRDFKAGDLFIPRSAAVRQGNARRVGSAAADDQPPA